MKKITGKIRILFLIDELRVGGTEKQLLLLSETLPINRFDPSIGVLRTNSSQFALDRKVRIIDFSCDKPRLFRYFTVVEKLRKYIDSESIDIIQTYFHESSIYGGLARALSRSHPVWVSTRRNLYHWVTEEPWMFRFMCWTAKSTDWVLVNSHSAFTECQTREKIPARKIYCIPNAVTIERFQDYSVPSAKKEIGLDGVYPVVGVLANWRPVKGLHSFLLAARQILERLPTTHFVLAGSGPLKDELILFSKELGISSKVTFLENPSNINNIITAFDIAVQPSLTESFSNVLLEYMAASRPIVATRVGDADRIIDDAENGILISPNSPEQLTQAVLALCMNPHEAARLASNAKDKAATNWGTTRMLNNYDNFYTMILQRVG